AGQRFHSVSSGHSLAGVEADDKLRNLEDYGNAVIVKAAPKLRQHFCLFLRVDRDRAEEYHDLPPVVSAWHTIKRNSCVNCD
ncbi:MAG TPA: hypothetical protein PLW50_09985, partial [Smithellaceae bacterium]|nr:hypothetical protein [Smithellaceae bacterium]